MLFIRSMIFDFLMYSLMLVMGILFAPLAIWSRDGAYWSMKFYSRTIFWLLKVICGLRVEVRGQVPEGAVIIGSKHQSFLDVMLHMHALPRAKYIMKDQLKWAPIIGIYGIRIGSTPVSRGKKGKAMTQMVAGVEKKSATERGQLVIYPQGTRTLPDQKLPYKVGAGVLYERMGVPCVPAATNVGVFWGRRSPYRKPGLAVLEYLEPIEPGMAIKPFLAELENRVEAASDRLMAEAGHVKAGQPPA